MPRKCVAVSAYKNILDMMHYYKTYRAKNKKLLLAALMLAFGTMATAQVKVGGSVFGGGNLADVKGSCTVTINQTGAEIGTLVGDGENKTLKTNTGDVYGGGAKARVNVTTNGSGSSISYAATPDKSTSVTLTQGTVHGNVYGGGLGRIGNSGSVADTAADVYGPVTVTINGGTVSGSVFGCNNLFGAPQSTVTVNIEKGSNDMIVHNVYGGGNLAAYSYSGNNYPEVNIIHGTVSGSVFGGGYGATAQVTGNPQVIIGDNNSEHTATVNGNVYGGGDLAAVTGSPYIKVQNANSSVAHEIYGGGNQANVSNSTTVDIIDGTIGENVYGGGALANVGTNANDSTTVNILGGTVTGNVYGGGLGRKEGENDAAVAAAVNGVVTVNIGSLTGDLDEHGFAPSTSVSGMATIGGAVFGCNNTNGSPKDNVFVNIYKTARTDAQQTTGSGYALSQVFGGGNQAAYQPSTIGKKTTVHVWTCDNTIEYVYGGGNAADVGNSTTNSATEVILDGGRIEWVFGGGNGKSTSTFANPGANVYGNATVIYHAGKLTYIFGGSNEKGNVTGTKTVDILVDGNCDKEIAELYGGSNMAATDGNVELTMSCTSWPDGFKISKVFGGSRDANIKGNVTLTIEGGTYDYVFGGNNIGGTIGGNVTLNLKGGTINEAASATRQYTLPPRQRGPAPTIPSSISIISAPKKPSLAMFTVVAMATRAIRRRSLVWSPVILR